MRLNKTVDITQRKYRVRLNKTVDITQRRTIQGETTDSKLMMILHRERYRVRLNKTDDDITQRRYRVRLMILHGEKQGETQ